MMEVIFKNTVRTERSRLDGIHITFATQTDLLLSNIKLFTKIYYSNHKKTILVAYAFSGRTHLKMHKMYKIMLQKVPLI